MGSFVHVSCILFTWFMFANCARIHVVDQPSYAPSLAPSESRTTNAPNTNDCSDVIFAMADCVPFLSDGSNITKPGDSCCPGFEMVLKASDDCICEAIESSSDLGIPLNMTKAMSLPSACGISAPSLFSQCDLPLPPGSSTPVNPKPKSSSSPKRAPTSSVNVVPPAAVTAPTPSPHSGTYSISASLVLLLSTLSASLYCVSL